MYVGWFVLSLFVLIKRELKLRITGYVRYYIISYVALIVISILLIYIDETRVFPNSISVMLIPIVILVISTNLREYISADILSKICICYFLAAISMAIWVNLTYFQSYSNWLSANQYIYTQKNSAAQIWCSAIIIAISVLKPKKPMLKLAIAIGCIYLFSVVILSQCRTAILAMICVLLIYVVKRKRRLLWIIIIAIIMIVLFANPFTREIIEHALFADKYKNSDINTISSGRISQIEQSLEYFMEEPLFGIGAYYIDCSYVRILAESGIVGFILIEGIWIRLILINLKYSENRTGNSETFMAALTVFYIVESFLEGYPPFGPGVSSFMFWFLNGIVGFGLPNKKALSHDDSKSLGD